MARIHVCIHVYTINAAANLSFVASRTLQYSYNTKLTENGSAGSYTFELVRIRTGSNLE